MHLDVNILGAEARQVHSQHVGSVILGGVLQQQTQEKGVRMHNWGAAAATQNFVSCPFPNAIGMLDTGNMHTSMDWDVESCSMFDRLKKTHHIRCDALHGKIDGCPEVGRHPSRHGAYTAPVAAGHIHKVAHKGWDEGHFFVGVGRG